MNPAPYPGNSAEEMQAVAVLLSLLDLRYAKPDIRVLDKRPNSDGQIEIVDEEQRSLGKIEVQVKKIPDGHISYQCPVELVAYSEKISLPFFLICVDVGNKKAYFRHLNPQMMPGLREGQQSFSIKFEPNVHGIKVETQYLEQWLRIIKDYNKRIVEYPALSLLGRNIGLAHISKPDRIYFQQFIDCVNSLLDTAFHFVKDEFFRGVWKLGVAIFSADQDHVNYQIYTILPGDPDIRVTGVDEHPELPTFMPKGNNVASAWVRGEPGSKTHQIHWTSRVAQKPPKEEAEDFVFKHAKSMLREFRLPLHGTHLAIEYLFWFIDRFGQSVGIQAADRLSVSELNFGISVYLPTWLSVAGPRYINELIEMNRGNPQALAQMIAALPFEAVAGTDPDLYPAKQEILKIIGAARKLSYPLRFTQVSPELLCQAVDCLLANREERIERPYKERSSFGPRIWSGYSKEALFYNMESIFSHSVEDYKIFVEKNRIPVAKSPFLDPNNALLFALDFESLTNEETTGNPSILSTYIVGNPDRKLPRMTIIDLDQFKSELMVNKRRLIWRGVERDLVRWKEEIATDLFKDLPALKNVYKMLKEDLEFNNCFSY
jgi:hypothetical protein